LSNNGKDGFVRKIVHDLGSRDHRDVGQLGGGTGQEEEACEGRSPKGL
jgi:hypothetical protein